MININFKDKKGKIKILAVLFFIYVFLVSIKLIGVGFKGLGKEFAETLILTTTNPFVALFIGILATSVLQSSSCVTSIVVGLVGVGTLNLSNAIPIVMGANIGTTVTNTLVSLAHITRKVEIRRAFAGATVHDIFNLLVAAILLPLELTIHYLEHISSFVARAFVGIGGIKLLNPLKLCTQPVINFFTKRFFFCPTGIIILGVFLLFISLYFITRYMRLLTLKRAERVIDRYLFNRPWKSFGFGVSLTAVVQSSSVTTSLVIPLVGARILSVEKIFPYVLGANLGTTVTAILAALVIATPSAITLAFCHLFFNISGILIFYPFRKIPIAISKMLAQIVTNHRWFALFYIAIIFFIIPLLLISLWR
ncbi:MAG: Na/Pi symporter [Candidatus Omnitrophica bacterium]|nr:Na/Pi symporter [Candidatus Omnitrophota bacterium]